jgi:histidinol-phosphate aminotransferase
VQLIHALHKIRDSYNVNGVGQIAAEATLDALSYYRKNFRRIAATRARLAHELERLGFDVLPSATNFLLVRPPRFEPSEWLEELRALKVLVRWFQYPELKEYLRISIGTDREIAVLLRAVRTILK